MIEAVIRWSVGNRFFVLLATAILVGVGIFAVKNTPVDAIPDLSDVQVIIKTRFPGQAPQVVEDQVTYPLTTAMLSVPGAATVRGYSFFGDSYVYVIFDEGTDLYWARSRVLEYLNFAAGRLPDGVRPQIGPDATGVGWVYIYTLSDPSGRHNLQELRSLQDWLLKYELSSLTGVAEVASLGGFVKQYQVEPDPTRLLLHDVSLALLRERIAASNLDVGGRLVEMGETEYMVRGRGYIRDPQDIRSIVLKTSDVGNPITVGDVARVGLGPEIRRGIAEWNGEGEVVAGIVLIRFGENALEVIDRVKERLRELGPGLPEGVEIHAGYDRSTLIYRAIDNITWKLFEEMAVVAAIIMLFLWHARSALVAILTLPLGVLASLFTMYVGGINANIMSLGGIAIAIGVMVDASIVMVENLHKHLEHRPDLPHLEVVKRASVEVGPALFYSLLIITVSFLPVLVLEEQSGRLFRPLVLTKTFAMAFASLIAVTIIPVLMSWFVKGNIKREDELPISRFLIRHAGPILRWSLDRKRPLMIGVAAIILLTLIPIKGIPKPGGGYLVRPIGGEFMPPLNEGDILYMPTTFPGISITKARELLQQTDAIIMGFPEVEHVLGKIGRAETATDPAPLMMIETTITLKPRSEWRPGMTFEKLRQELDAAIQFPGLRNAWTFPIRTRIDMLATGIKTPVGIKLLGDDLEALAAFGSEIEAILAEHPGTASIVAERVTGGHYIDFEIDREAAARYGITVGDIQFTIMTAIGGMNVTETVEGLARYPVNIRYPREYRDSIQKLGDIWVDTPRGPVPLSQVTHLRVVDGPPDIKTENARKTAWIYIDLEPGQDVQSYVESARAHIMHLVEGGELRVPDGVTILWSGQYEYLSRAAERLKISGALALIAILVLMYMHFRNFLQPAILLGCLLFAVTGGFWLMYVFGYNRSVATDVGFIALAGLSVETGIVLLVYLDEVFARYKREARLNTPDDVRAAMMEGVVGRVRPKIMAVSTTFLGLVPILWATEAGSEVMKRLAVPMLGGFVTDTMVTLIIIPIVYEWIQLRRLREGRAGPLHFVDDETLNPATQTAEVR